MPILRAGIPEYQLDQVGQTKDKHGDQVSRKYDNGLRLERSERAVEVESKVASTANGGR